MFIQSYHCYYGLAGAKSPSHLLSHPSCISLLGLLSSCRHVICQVVIFIIIFSSWVAYTQPSSRGLNFDTSISRSTFPAGQARHRLAVPASHAPSRLVPIASFELSLIQHGSSRHRTRHRAVNAQLTAQLHQLCLHPVHCHDARDATHCPRSTDLHRHSLSRLSSSSTSTSLSSGFAL